MKTMYRILGERGRVTIPYEMRKAVGFANEDLLSFTIQDDNSILVRREKVCNHCRDMEAEHEEEISLLDFLNSLTEEQQRAAMVHLSANIGKPLQKKTKVGGERNG